MRVTLLFFCMLSLVSVANGQWLPTTKVTAPIFELQEHANKLYCSGYGGVFVSSDEGVNWKRIDNTGDPILHTKIVNDFQINAGNFYFRLSGSFYKSINLGKSYKGLSTEFCENYVLNGDEIMMVTSTSNSQAVKFSFDGGASWKIITANLPNNTPIRRLLFYQNLYYVLYASGDLYVSPDKGQSWKNEATGLGLLDVNISDNKAFAVAKNAMYYHDAASSSWIKIPLNGTPEHISAIGTTLFAPLNDTTLLRSDDLGKNWYPLLVGQHLFWPNRFYKKIFVTSKGTLFAASDLGASYSKDGGYTWTPVNNEGFFLQGCWSVSVAGDNILAGYNNGGNSGVFVSKDNTLTWQGSYPLRQILSTQVTDNATFITEGQLYRSLDYGANWENLKVDTLFRNYFYLANTEQYLFVTASAVFNEFELFRTNNKGATWTKVNTTGLGTQRVNYLASNKNKLFSVVHPSQDLYASSDEGETWKQVTSGEPSFKFFTRVFCFDSLIVACQSSDIFASKDNGITWRSIKNNLLYNYYNITVLYHDHKLLISGDGLPVQLSNEDFTEWYEIDPTGLPFNNDNYGMAIKGQDLYLAQRRNGLFKRNLNEILKVSTIDLSTTIPALFPNPASQVLQLEVRDGATYEIFGIDGRSWVTKSKTSGAIDVSQLPTGTYILKISESEGGYSRKFVKE